MKYEFCKREQELMAEVSEARLLEYTQHVAAEVRLSGTPEEKRAFLYVKKTLEEFGLSTDLMYSDAYISLPGKAQLRVAGVEYRCITHAMAIPTDAAGLEAELVYLGKGSPQDYREADAAGKIVLLDGLAIPGAVKQAQEAGAAGAVFINAAYTHEMIVSPVWGNPTPETFSLLPKIPVVSVNRADGDRIKAALQSKGTTKVWMKTQVDTGWRKIPTLVAEIRGNVEPEKFVMFSGHIDSWHYGAMDNGSANATMLEVARILAKHRDKLRRTLRLAFWSGHSHGRYAGSAWYCDTHWEELYDNCVLHINIDSVGGKGAVVLGEANCMAETKSLAERSVGLIAGQEFYGSRFGRAGDQSFWGTGTPSLFMGLSEQARSDDPAAQAFALLFGDGRAGGFGWWWHTTEDTPDKLDPRYLVRDCKVYLDVVYNACSQALLPLDQRAAVEELIGYLKQYQEKAGERLDLTAALERAGRLKEVVAQFYACLEQGNSLSAEQLQVANETMMRLSRILVPLNYVRGSIFDHDLAMKQAPLPALAEIDRLAEAQAGSDEYYQLRTVLIRRVNRVNFALREAIAETEAALDQLQKL
ncbi:M28 family peptidase [Paenactinomyces guangxiensis]|uniref:M28 family peptidase n=1 Tax=Paenactinomyces guangxiensis TaxID=1490290 RepID=A0A7W1WR30_9BACL|nr:M28 family peptidase [Paenactinomyces guangxiensis]MBA4494321.1 M28 family peptidase [Paenactinomyces guangxiensis]MBH8590816.1 M28 family peptidase [Paenactinomyces guangxiensis]